MTKFLSTRDDDIILKFATPHEENKTGTDVDGLYIANGVYQYLPININEYFPNLKAIWVQHTGLKEIKPCHLSAYKDLREISIQQNEIETLDNDLFAKNKKLEYINLSNNKIKYVDANIFRNLDATLFIVIRIVKNPCIDEVANTPAKITALKTILQDQCPSKKTYVPRGGKCLMLFPPANQDFFASSFKFFQRTQQIFAQQLSGF